MPTNDEIKKKYNIKKQQELLTLEDLERIIGTEGFNGLIKDWNNQISLFLDDLDKMLNEARADGYKEGQTDTAKQIFKAIKELDDKLINPDYDDLKAVIEAVQKQFKVD